MIYRFSWEDNLFKKLTKKASKMNRIWIWVRKKSLRYRD